MLQNPCNNHGICYDKLNEYACECDEGFSGVDCEIEPSDNG